MSQFIEMFDFHELNLNSPSKDFESMCLDDTSSATKIPAAEYLQEGKYAVYDQAQEKDIAGYSNTEQGLCRNYPAVLFGDHSRVVKYINEPFFIGADGVKIIRPREENLIPEFLYYDLKYHNIPNTGYNRHFKYIKMISLTKASLEEQSQFLSIAHQADKSGFDGRKSQFIEMFGDNVSKKKISDVCDVRGGSTPTRTTKEFWNNGTISWFTIEDIYEQGRYISETKQHITELATKKCFVYPVDTVLICCTASVGEYAITKKEMASNQQFNGMMIKDKSELHPEYLLYVASTLKEDLLRQAGKTTINFVSRSKLENIEIPVPPYSEQLGFVSVYRQADKSGFRTQQIH